MAAGRSKDNVALVAGATGVTGRNLILQLEKSGLWSGIYGSSRRPLNFGQQVKHLPLDLSDRSSLEGTLAKAPGVTHLFFCAFQATGDYLKDVEVNFGMFKALVEASEAAGHKLKHVHFVSGTKWYGNHIGPIKTPSRETDYRAMPPNFYYNMEDYCVQRAAEFASWSWSSVRPNPVCGFSTGSAMNLTMTIAVYASICKQLGLPLRFPGSPKAYDVLLEVIDVELLAEGIEWISLHPTAGNTSYNLSNGDIFRWSEVWPQIAAHFELPVATPQKFDMVDIMRGQETTWDGIVKEHGLVPHAMKEIATWEFGNWTFAQEQDWFSSVSKLRRAGFNGMKVDTADMFIRQFEQLSRDKVIP